MISKRKAPSAKNITPKMVDSYVESLGGWELTDKQKKKLDELDKNLKLGKHKKK
jgi:hypothetical protein